MVSRSFVSSVFNFILLNVLNLSALAAHFDLRNRTRENIIELSQTLCEIFSSEYQQQLETEEECRARLLCELIQEKEESCKEKYSANMPDRLILNTKKKVEIVEGKSLKYPYSTVSCLGGTQTIDESVLRTSNHQGKFKTTDGSFKVCRFHNVCMLYGTSPTMVYFVDPHIEGNLPPEHKFQYLPFTQQPQLGYFTEKLTVEMQRDWIPIHYINESIPLTALFHTNKLIPFLLSHSYGNYGHHLYDMMYSIFVAAKYYQIPMKHVVQLIDYQLWRFPWMPSFTKQVGLVGPQRDDNGNPIFLKNDRILADYYRLQKWIKLNTKYVFDLPPIYLEPISAVDLYSNEEEDIYMTFSRSKQQVSEVKGHRSCFQTLIAGAASAFSQKSWQITGGSYLQEFRDYIIQRIQERKFFTIEQQERLQQTNIEWYRKVIVLLSGNNAIWSTIDERDYRNTLMCNLTKEIIYSWQSDWEVECIAPEELITRRKEIENIRNDNQNGNFLEELILAQSARLFISFHGTVSYPILFAKDYTKMILMTTDEKGEFGKDYHIFSRASHFTVHYLTESMFASHFSTLIKYLISIQIHELDD
jgi:hypothetical protein